MDHIEAAEILSFVAGDNFEMACAQHGRETVLNAMANAAKVLRERAAAEPVAWLYEIHDPPQWISGISRDIPPPKRACNVVPLYTAPHVSASDAKSDV